MSAFEPIINEPPIAEKATDSIIQTCNSVYNYLKTIQQQLYQGFWFAGIVNPQEICDVLKAKGIPPALFFQLNAQLVELINTAKPGTIPEQLARAQKAVTISLSTGDVTIDMNDDSGTITYVD